MSVFPTTFWSCVFIVLTGNDSVNRAPAVENPHVVTKTAFCTKLTFLTEFRILEKTILVKNALVSTNDAA